MKVAVSSIVQLKNYCMNAHNIIGTGHALTKSSCSIPLVLRMLLLNIHAGGIQAAKAVGGIVGGCVLLLLLTVSSVTTCLILKRKGFTLSTNSSSKTSVGKQQEVNIITEDNIAYNCKSVRAEVTHVPIDTALEVVYDNAELRSTDSMEENIMAYYESLTVDEISLRSNAAYHKSERALSRESDCDISDQYEYI